MNRLTLCAGLALLLAAPAAHADIKINEIYFSPEDPAVGRQYFEIINTAGAAPLTNLWFLEIEGDAPIGDQLDNRGQVLNAFNLGSFSTGANGLLLWRDTAVVLDNDPAAGVQGPGAATVATGGFSQVFGFEQSIGDPMDPNEEIDLYVNEVHTFLLVSGFTGAVGDDLDPLDAGSLDVTKWTSVLDAITAQEAGVIGSAYAAQFGGTVFNGTFGPDLWARTPSAGPWLFFDSGNGEDDGDYVGPFYANDGEGDAATSNAAYQDGTVIIVEETSTFLFATPGAANPTGVPEPGSAALAAVATALAGAMRRRRR